MAAKKNAANKKNDIKSKAAPRRTSTTTAKSEEEEESVDADDILNAAPANEDADVDSEDLDMSSNDDEEDEDDEDDEEDDDLEEAQTAAPGAASNGSSALSNGEAPKRGKKGKRGKRKIHFCCAAWINDKLVHEEIQVKVPESDDERFDKDAGQKEASAAFEKQFGAPPLSIKGPNYSWKGVQQAQKKRETITITVGKTPPPFSGERSYATHTDSKGIEWSVLINHTTDPNIGFAFYQRAVDAELAKANKVQKPGPKYLPMDAFRNKRVAKDSDQAED